MKKPTQSSTNNVSTDSGPRNQQQHDADKQVDRQQQTPIICGAVVDNGVETQNTKKPVGGGQGDDDGYAASNVTEAEVLWSQSRTIIELKTYYCDEDANEYVVRRPRVRLPGPTNLNGNDEKLVPKSHKIETALHNLLVSKRTDHIVELKLPSSAEHSYALEDLTRPSSSSSSTSFSEEFFDAVEHQPASAPPESSMQSLSQRQLSNSNWNAPAPKFIPKTPTAPCC